jgi:hypothetical protein
MATTTLTLNPTKITAPDANENDIDFDTILDKLGYAHGLALVDGFSAATQFSANGQAITSNSGSYSSGSAIIPISKNINLRYKTSNSATFNICITAP